MRPALAFAVLALVAPLRSEAESRCPNVVIVLDGSDSMGQPPSSSTTESKISIAKRVLGDLLLGDSDAGVPAPNPYLRFGFTSFPNVTNCTAGQTDPMPQECAYGDNSATASAINAVTLHNSTPTAKTLAAVAVTSDLEDPTRPKYVVVLTDGQPTCGDDGSESVAAIDQLRDGGAETFVIGFGNVAAMSGAVKVLNEMAAAGQPALADGGTATFYPATDDVSLATALASILSHATNELGMTESCDPCADVTCTAAQSCSITASGPTCVANPCGVATCTSSQTCEPFPDAGYTCLAPPDSGPPQGTSGSTSSSAASGSSTGGHGSTAVSGSCSCSSAPLGLGALAAVLLLRRRRRW